MDYHLLIQGGGGVIIHFVLCCVSGGADYSGITLHWPKKPHFSKERISLFGNTDMAAVIHTVTYKRYLSARILDPTKRRSSAALLIH